MINEIDKLIADIIPSEDCIKSIQKSFKLHNLNNLKLNDNKTKYTPEEFYKILSDYEIRPQKFVDYIDEYQEEYIDKYELNYVSKLFTPQNERNKPEEKISQLVYEFVKYKVYETIKNELKCMPNTTNTSDFMNIKKLVRFTKILDELKIKYDGLICTSPKDYIKIIGEFSLDDLNKAIFVVDQEEMETLEIDNFDFDTMFDKEIENLNNKYLLCIYANFKTFLLLENFEWELLKRLAGLNKEKLELIEKEIIKIKVKKEVTFNNVLNFHDLLNVKFNEIELDLDKRKKYYENLIKRINLLQGQGMVSKYDLMDKIVIIQKQNSETWKIFCFFIFSNTKDREFSVPLNRIINKYLKDFDANPS